MSLASQLAQNSKLYVSTTDVEPYSWVQIKQLQNIKPGGSTAASIDVSDLDDNAKSSKAGVNDNGSFAADVYILESDAGQDYVLESFKLSLPKVYKYRTPARNRIFKAFCTKFPTIPDKTIDKVLSGTVEWKITNKIDYCVRYWVGGDGVWDATDTTHWSLLSGDTAGALAPTVDDIAAFDSNSGSPNVTISGYVPIWKMAGVPYTVGQLRFDVGSSLSVQGGVVPFYEILSSHYNAYDLTLLNCTGTLDYFELPGGCNVNLTGSTITITGDGSLEFADGSDVGNNVITGGTFYIPESVTITEMTHTTFHNVTVLGSVLDATDSTNIDGGGNSGIYFIYIGNFSDIPSVPNMSMSAVAVTEGAESDSESISVPTVPGITMDNIAVTETPVNDSESIIIPAVPNLTINTEVS